MGKQPAVMASDRLAVFMPDAERKTLNANTDHQKLINHSGVVRTLTNSQLFSIDHKIPISQNQQ